VTEKLEQLEHEKSLLADTPTGQLREQVKSLSDTLSVQARDLEIARKDAEEAAKQMAEENTNLQFASRHRLSPKSPRCADLDKQATSS
jgi:hypothetical protein